MRAAAGRARLAAAAAAAVLAVAACSGGPGGAATPRQGTTAAAATTSANGPAATPATGEPTTALVPEPSASASTPRSLVVVAGGDVLLHQATWRQADADAGRVGDGQLDFGPQLAAIGWLVGRADLALCHMETPLARPGGPYTGYPSFSGPPQVADALAGIGFDACSLASNHTFDQGLAGVARTADTLQRAGLTAYGARAGDRPANPTVVTVRTPGGPVRVGLLSYTYGFNGRVPAGGAAVARIASAKLVRADAATARSQGAEVVIASMHWGSEYVHAPNSMQRSLASQLAAVDDLDLVVGHHAHVVQPFARVGGTWVAYGLGNMLASHATPLAANQEGVLAEFTFTPAGARRWEVSRAAYQPILVDRTRGGVRLVAVPQDTAGARTGVQRERYRLAERRTRQVVTSLGAPVVQLATR